MKLAKSAALAVSATLLLSGCAIGFGAATNTQGASGNGRSASIGDIQVRGATLVVDANSPKTASLVATFVNTNQSSDNGIDGVIVDSTLADSSFPIALPAGAATAIGFNSEIYVTSNAAGLKPGSFHNVTVLFSDGSTLDLSLLVNTNEDAFAEVVIPTVEPTPVAITPAPVAQPSVATTP